MFVFFLNLQSAYHKSSGVDKQGMSFDLQSEKFMKKNLTHSVIKTGFYSMIILLISCNSSRRSIGIEEGWELLSEQKVNFVRDKDQIDINNRTPYTAMRFKVEDKDVHLKDLKVYFQNGDKLEPSLDEEIKAGELSRVIDLGREGRYIDRIEFNYRSAGNILTGRANVLVLGRKYYRDY
jgi:hypothetical protein